jgi:hypothetical protein
MDFDVSFTTQSGINLAEGAREERAVVASMGRYMKEHPIKILLKRRSSLKNCVCSVKLVAHPNR